MVKTHKIALKPNKAQAPLLSKHCGYARVAYNHALNAFRDGLKKDAFKSLYTLKHRHRRLLANVGLQVRMVWRGL